MSNEGGLNYLNTISSNGAYSLIDKPTRVTNVSQTTIDHIVTNDLMHVMHPIIFLSDIASHYPIAQGRTQRVLKGGLNFSKSNQYPLVVDFAIGLVKRGFAVIVRSLQHFFIEKRCNNDFKSCWL